MANTKITSRVIADNAVTTAAIADDAITEAKLASGVGGVAGIVSSADATAITIDSSERVGIGGSPSQKLTVSTTSASQAILISTSSANSDSGIGFTNDAQSWSLANRGGLSDSLVIRDVTASADRVVVDTSGNVGIGTSSPLSLLQLAKATIPSSITRASNYLQIGGSEEGLNGYQVIGFGYNDSGRTYMPAYIGFKQTVASSGNAGDLIFGTRADGSDAVPTERARLTKDGNLLVGTTDTTIYNNAANNATDNGMVYSAIDSRLDVTRYTTNTAAAVASFNRTGNDGNILSFAKSGTTVGSIGVGSNQLIIDASAGNLVLENFSRAIAFSSTAFAGSGSANDAVIDLGISNRRFKDLYLSGTASVGHVIPNTQGTYSINHLGVYSGGITVNAATSQTGYLMSAGTGIVGFGPNGGSIRLGGTAAANELDDYEEGTWTPNIKRGNGTVPASYNSVNASYVKIGNIVHAKVFISNLSNGSSDGTIYWVIYNIPFAASVETYSGVVLAYNSSPCDNCYVGDAGGNAVLCVGASPYSGAISGAFMLNITYRVN